MMKKQRQKNFKPEAIASLEKLTEKLTALSAWTVENIHEAMNATSGGIRNRHG